ncbi:hypothetical protein ASPZODRAFT_139262 [Penicilliopsis zonata CBS 506.65]|uniref:Tyrosine specific protein phosphatases domain-containing protein n=1 Tax=Penicilliopsis zonata CBS 506.65 TaxID=1073090 RepID=A0A1L9SS51_9EURO|nr:hypothetical protein ASPZODRAFT_139262 [Penicilliopsis zonata CBS 506.65]OJJ49917.1 hypothetical protein ASPZODRAFT_139262 [Penicilliopsis zonata CBS 506.65]
MDTPARHYVPTQEYTKRAPSQPRIPVALQPPSSSGPGDFQSHDYSEGDFIPPGFFERVDSHNFTQRPDPPEWVYEMRRYAQPILSFLYLGPHSCVKDLDYLKNEGFTLLLGIRNRVSAQRHLLSGANAAAELDIEADCIDVGDNQELISAFPRAIRRINDHLASFNNTSGTELSMVPKRKILVFCESGNERSATVVIVYLMVMLNLNMSEAISMVQHCRFCTSIEDPIRQILASFESILQAKRDVERTRRTSGTLASNALSPTTSKKRNLFDRSHNTMQRGDDDGDDDDSMDEADAFMIDRMAMAPFQDR